MSSEKINKIAPYGESDRNQGILKRVMDALQLEKKKDLADFFKVRRASISDFLRKGWPKKRLQEVADASGVQMAWLEYGEEIYYRVGEFISKNEKTPLCPVYEFKRPGQGDYFWGRPLGYIDIARFFTHADQVDSTIKLFKVTHESLSPEIKGGDVICVNFDMESENLIDGRPYVLYMPESGMTLKYLQCVKDGYEFYSSGEAVKPIFFTKGDIIMGRVVVGEILTLIREYTFRDLGDDLKHPSMAYE